MDQYYTKESEETLTTLEENMKKDNVVIGFVPKGPTEQFFKNKILTDYEFGQVSNSRIIGKDPAITGSISLKNDIYSESEQKVLKI